MKTKSQWYRFSTIMQCSNTFKKGVIILVLFTQILTIYSQTEYGMSLGDLSFVKPSAELSKMNRSIKMRVATRGITNRIFAKVGGVAFIQTAKPNFEIETFELKCDTVENTAYAIINNKPYQIPLEVWQLKPIVEYADDINNVAVTLYGDDGVRIKYHEAFINELLGLRLLQTDLMLASNILGLSERCKFPANENGYILSDKERNKYELLNNIYKLFSDVDYDTFSLLMSIKLYNIIDSIGERFDTYLFTDYGEDIRFDIQDSTIVFVGEPYYRFANRDEMLVDTTEMFSMIENYVDSFFIRKAKYDRLTITDTYKKKNNETLYAINKYLKTSSKEDVVNDVFKKLNYYEISDTFNVSELKLGVGFINYYLNDYVDSIFNVYSLPETENEAFVSRVNIDEQLYNVCLEIKQLLDKDAFYTTPLLCDYIKYLYDLYPNDVRLETIYNIANIFDITNEKLFIYFLISNKIPIAKVMDITTDCVRNSGFVYGLNPIVFDSANKTCHWTALFRYAKQNYSDNWNDFKQRIHCLKNDAPAVWTPIYFE